MKLTFAYLGRSRMIEAPTGGERILSLAPNLTRASGSASTRRSSNHSNSARQLVPYTMS